MNKPSKIKDNPSISKISNQIETLNNISKLSPIVQQIFPKTKSIFNQINELQDQANIIEIPDEFNEKFAKLGWIAYESMNLDVMQKAIEIFESEDPKKAELFLADYYDEKTITAGIFRFKGHAEFERRIRLIELAKEDYLAERYHACIPLLLSLLDGIVNDISKHVGFFAESIDMTAWDSIAAHETGLQTIASLFSESRNKTNDEVITLPYRNGILHGRELAFDNKLVAAKVWATLFAIKDWSVAFSNKPNENEKETSWCDLFKDIVNNNKEKRLINNWKPRSSSEIPYLPYSGPASKLPLNTPERAVAEFIENWINGRYGPLSEALMCFVNKPKGKKAGLAKNHFGRYSPQSYRLISIEDKAASQTSVKVELLFDINSQKIIKTINVLTNYVDDNNKPLVRSENSGYWKITQNSFSDIIDGSLEP